MVQGTWNESSREWTVHGTNGPRLLGGKGLQCLFVLGNEWSRERMFQGTNSLENDSSRERMVPRTKVPSWERMFQGMISLENEYSSIRSQRQQLTKIGNYPFNTMQNNTIICKPRCKHKLHSHFSAVLSLGQFMEGNFVMNYGKQNSIWDVLPFTAISGHWFWPMHNCL